MVRSKVESIANFTSNRFGAIIAIVIVITLLFIMVLGSIEPNTSSEAMNSDTEIHRAWKKYEDSFRPSVHGIPVVVEAKDGNVLNMEEFRDINDALDKIEQDEIINPLLIEFYDDSLYVNKTSISAIPNAVRIIMDGNAPFGYDIGYHTSQSMGNNFANATDDDLNLLLTDLLQYTDVSGTFVYKEIVSAELEQKNGRWDAPVMMIFIAVDNDLLEINYTYDYNDKDKKFFEEFDLHVMDILKDNIDTCDVYGVGVGVEDEINKEINESIPFYMFVFIIIVIILAITFKHNLKSFLAATIGLVLVLIWMLASARLLNLSETQFTAFLPVLILALGIDYAIHSMKRFDEELIEGETPRNSVKNTILKLSGTLALAMLTTFVAFFSNVFSTIPALRDWGLEAGMAIIWTFLIMGFFVPALRLGFERAKNRDIPYYKNVAQNPKDKNSENPGNKKKAKSRAIPKNRLGAGLSKLTFGSLSHPSAIIVVIILLVLPLGYGAMNLGTDFELEEFFNPESDFVVGLDIYTEHFPTGGEPNLLLIEGDIAEPSVVDAVNISRERFEERGYATFYSLDVAELVQNFTQNLWVNNLVGGNDIVVTDTDSNGIPDERVQVHTILRQAYNLGLFIFVNGNVTQVYTSGSIQEVLHYDEDEDEFDLTVMAIGVSGSGSLDNIKKGMKNILDDSEVIEDTGEAEVVVTGSGPLRLEQLTAISNSMFYSIIISIIVCFIIIAVIFRKLGLAFVAILPVILISIWLYGSMYFTGFNLNIVTSTIGAMSVGVGVDYSIHVSDRFRKEKAAGKTFDAAMHSTISNSGSALVFSALTTTFGFFVLLFAPMPMFFSFGLFSGLMVLMALIASVIVVPPLIKLVVREKGNVEGKDTK